MLPPEGHFLQAEVTSCGLNDGPLRGEGEYHTYIACNVWSKDGVGWYDGFKPVFRLRRHLYLTQNAKDGDESAIQYIANTCEGAVAEFKYFDIRNVNSVRLTVGGKCDGNLLISDRDDFSDIAVCVPVKIRGSVANLEGRLKLTDGVKPLYFKFMGRGKPDFYAFELH